MLHRVTEDDHARKESEQAARYRSAGAGDSETDERQNSARGAHCTLVRVWYWFGRSRQHHADGGSNKLRARYRLQYPRYDTWHPCTAIASSVRCRSRALTCRYLYRNLRWFAARFRPPPSRASMSLISFSIHCASHKMRAVFCCVLLVTTCSALTVNAPRPLIGTQRVRTSAVFMAAPIPARANLVPLEAIRSSTACVLHKASCLCSKARAFVIATLSAMSLRQYAYALGAVVIVAALRFLFQSDKVVRRARAEPRRCRFA